MSTLEEDDEDDMAATQFTPPPQRRSSFARLVTPVKFMVELGEGSPVGEYEIKEQIGEGAMGTVYLAVHPLIGKTVAIKVLKPELCANQASVDRFVQEAQAVNQIGHPNIVDVFSLGELPDGRAYFVMELLRGEDLKARLKRGPLDLAETCDILDGIARALEAAHAKGIVHRDLKPDNVYLHQVESGPLMVKLLDFGIAKLLRTQQQMEKTQTGNMLGTPRYISPEQARGVDVTPRSDIYSLGVMAYEMLSGHAPFEGETAMDLVVKHLNEQPPPLSQFVKVPRGLDQCVMRMLHKDPIERPSIGEIRQVLGDPNRRVIRPILRVRRWPILVVMAGMLIGGGVTAWQLGYLDGDDAAAGAIAQPAPPPAPPVRAAIAAPPPTPTRLEVPPSPPVATDPPADGPGRIEVHVTGAKDAVVLLDGKVWGKGTSLEIETAAGEHDITVRAKGREPITQHIEVRAGQLSAVAVVVPAPTPAKPPKKPPRKPPRDGTQKPPPDEDALLKPKSVK
ncbi:MAG TPA: serine/threonine-protein kinase [Kofleriaceae bacterium]|nr:serine/threonine-protein kinase [Kofleriaceae bacterium]